MAVVLSCSNKDAEACVFALRAAEKSGSLAQGLALTAWDKLVVKRQWKKSWSACRVEPFASIRAETECG